jgi:hypothetical protein
MFPGFLAPAARAFDALWERRIVIEAARRPISIPDRSGAILIQAAHAMRNLSQTPRHREEFRYLVDAVIPQLSRKERSDVLELAVELAAVDTLRPFLDFLELALPTQTKAGIDPALDEWRSRVAGEGVVATRVVELMRGKALGEKIRLGFEVIWASDEDFRLDHPEVSPGRGPLLRARFARFFRGLRSARALVLGRRAARRGVTVARSLTEEPP